jgi:hypothetical protein
VVVWAAETIPISLYVLKNEAKRHCHTPFV